MDKPDIERAAILALRFLCSPLPSRSGALNPLPYFHPYDEQLLASRGLTPPFEVGRLVGLYLPEGLEPTVFGSLGVAVRRGDSWESIVYSARASFSPVSKDEPASELVVHDGRGSHLRIQVPGTEAASRLAATYSRLMSLLSRTNHE